MFFLLRVAFWLGLVLVLLPRDTAPDPSSPQVNASEAVTAAGAAMSDMSQFCTRQPAACEVGGQAATAIGHRAQEGARKLYQMITEKKPDHTSSIDGMTVAHSYFITDDTLTPGDLDAEWQLPGSPP